MNIGKNTALYTLLDIQYQQEYSGPYESLDFEIPAAIKDGVISAYGRPLVGELPKDEVRRLYAISDKIWYMDFLDGKLSNISRFLLEQGLEPQPYYTQTIDLTQPVERLHSNLRKSYKSLVNKNPVISILGEVEPIHRLHAKVHKRETRNAATWFLQQRMIWNKQIFGLLQCEFPKTTNPCMALPVGGGLFYYNREICYYGVGCSLEGVNSHALLWTAILHAKKLGCKRFEMGKQIFSGDEKGVNISKFKRGFGGNTITYLEFRNELV